MEQKTNNPGQQAAPEQGTQEQTKAPSAWLQTVGDTFVTIGDELDKTSDQTRGIVVIAVDDGSTFVGTAGGSLPLAIAVKTVLTSPHFGRHVADACRVMAAEAADAMAKDAAGKGTIVIHVKQEPDGDADEGQEAKTDGD